MDVALRYNSAVVLRFDRGEDVLVELTRFCSREGIQAAAFTALGAAQEVELAWYNVDEKRYHTKKLAEKLEIGSLVGNVSLHEGELFIHTHGVFTNAAMQAFGGHVNRLVVAATCELVLQKLAGEIVRTYDAGVGLPLL